MPSYNSYAKPSTTYSDISELFSHLLINATDFLLIASGNGRLHISSDNSITEYTTDSKPSTSYTSITRPT